MIECDQCGLPYDGTAARWLCPHCKFKGNCCEGAPLCSFEKSVASETGG